MKNTHKECQQSGEQNGTSALCLCSGAFSGYIECPQFSAFQNISDQHPRVLIPVHFGKVTYANELILTQEVRSMCRRIFPKIFKLLLSSRQTQADSDFLLHAVTGIPHHQPTILALFTYTKFIEVLFFQFSKTLQPRVMWFSSYDTASQHC